MDSTLGHREALNTSQSLKLSVHFPVLDHILSEMGQRFSERNLKIMKGLQAFNPSSSHFLDISDLNILSIFYCVSDNLLSSECVLAKRSLADNNVESVMDVYSHLLPLQSAFPTLIKLIRIALAVAVSTADSKEKLKVKIAREKDIAKALHALDTNTQKKGETLPD